MQYTDDKTKLFASTLGAVINSIIKERNIKSINNFADQYDLDDSNLNKILKGKHNAKIVTIWKISEALGIKCSDLMKMLEDALGEDFTLVDE